jgi:hypothetical protein
MENKRDGPVILCEPLYGRHEHVPFNAAMIASALQAWPRSSMLIYGASAHLLLLRDELGRNAVATPATCEWRSIQLAGKNVRFNRRICYELFVALSVLREGWARKAKVIIFLSTNKTFLAVLKIIMWTGCYRRPVLIVPHDLLNELSVDTDSPPVAQRLSSLRVLQLSHPASLRYIVLGEAMMTALRVHVPCFARWFRSIDHPYLFGGYESMECNTVDRTISFGFFGVSKKGFEDFVWLAKTIQLTHPGKTRFVLVGYLNDEESILSLPAIQTVVEGVGDLPLSAEEYAKRGRSISYSIGTAPKSSYNIRACGTFLDSLKYRKSGLYLENPWIASYLCKIPSAGRVCRDRDELLNEALELIRNHSDAGCSTLAERIEIERTIFTASAVGPALRAIVEEVDSSL